MGEFRSKFYSCVCFVLVLALVCGLLISPAAAEEGGYGGELHRADSVSSQYFIDLFPEKEIKTYLEGYFASYGKFTVLHWKTNRTSDDDFYGFMFADYEFQLHSNQFMRPYYTSRLPYRSFVVRRSSADGKWSVTRNAEVDCTTSRSYSTTNSNQNNQGYMHTFTIKALTQSLDSSSASSAIFGYSSSGSTNQSGFVLESFSNFDVCFVETGEVYHRANVDVVAPNIYQHYLGTYKGVDSLFIPCNTAPTSVPITVTLGDRSVISFPVDSYTFVPSLGGDDLSYAVIPLYDLSSNLSFTIIESSVNLFGSMWYCYTELQVGSSINEEIDNVFDGTTKPDDSTPNYQKPNYDYLFDFVGQEVNGHVFETLLSNLSNGTLDDLYGYDLRVGYLKSYNNVVSWRSPDNPSALDYGLMHSLYSSITDGKPFSILAALFVFDVIIYDYEYEVDNVGDVGNVYESSYSVYLTPLFYLHQLTSITNGLSLISSQFRDMYALSYNAYSNDVQFLKEFIRSIGTVNGNLSSLERTIVAEVTGLDSSLVAELQSLNGTITEGVATIVRFADNSALQALQEQILHEVKNLDFDVGGSVDFAELLLPDWLVSMKDFVVAYVALPIDSAVESTSNLAKGITWVFDFYTDTSGAGFIIGNDDGSYSINTDMSYIPLYNDLPAFGD